VEAIAGKAGKVIAMKGRTLQIGHRKYDLYYRPLKESRRQFTYGQTSHIDRKIIINTNAHATEQGETLLHEIVHCISCENALDLSEQTVATLASSLYDVIHRNGIKI